MKKIWILLLASLFISCRDKLTQPHESFSQIFVSVFDDYSNLPMEGKQIILMQTRESQRTDYYGHAKFIVPAGNYTVMATELQGSGGRLRSVTREITVYDKETTAVYFLNCSSCDTLKPH